MRIINGIHHGKTLKIKKGLALRPTTDFAKEALFNILGNIIDFENISVLDLFTGTGNISYEFASRGARQVTSVDTNSQCVLFINSICKELDLKINTVKADAFDFLKKSKVKYDIIFADPPFNLNNIYLINELVFLKKLLNPDGILIIEHGKKTNLKNYTGFFQQRNYGNVNFSFFKHQ